MLQDFMITNNFYHYKSTSRDSCLKLDRVTEELRNLFDTQGWDENIHLERLKEKVQNKIHRIRTKIERENTLLSQLRNLVQVLPKEVHEDATRIFIEGIGQDIVFAALCVDYDGGNQPGGT